MSYTVNTTVPKNLENTAIQYWTGVYNGDAEQIRDALDPNVEIKGFSEMNGDKMPSATLTGIDAVVEQSLKISESIKSINNFGLSFAILKDETDEEVLAIRFQQDLVLQESEKGPQMEMLSRGLELWKWKDIGSDGNEKIVLTAGSIFEKDELSKYVSNEEELKNIVLLPIGVQDTDNQVVAQWSLSNCTIL